MSSDQEKPASSEQEKPAPSPAKPAPALLRQISRKHSHKSVVDTFEKKSNNDEPKNKPPARAVPPRLVRGKTGLMKERNHEDIAIATLVSEALPAWAGISPEDIEVSDVSGHGGSKTFKVTAPEGTEPPAVALHSRSESVTSEDISEPRLAAASAALLAAGVAPRRIAQGGDWYIVAWAGKALGSPFSACDAKPDELGKLMAKIHSVSAQDHTARKRAPSSRAARPSSSYRACARASCVPQAPTDWYEPFRAKMKELMPALARVADGSHIWWYSARMSEWLKDVDADAIAAYSAVMPAPTSKLGRRVVTSHGDFHAGNLVRDGVRRAHSTAADAPAQF